MKKNKAEHYGLTPYGNQMRAPSAPTTGEISKHIEYLAQQLDERLAEMAAQTQAAAFAIESRHYTHDVAAREYYEATSYTSQVTVAAQALYYGDEVTSFNYHNLQVLKRDLLAYQDAHAQRLHEGIQQAFKEPPKKRGFFG